MQPLSKSVKISRILHAGYVFECEGTQIAFDTIFENPFSHNCYAFPNVSFDHEKIKKLRFDAVFISHFHDDHCSFDSLNLLSRETPIYVYCIFEELFSWIQELGFTNVHSLKIDQSVNVGPFEVIPRRALDADVDSLFQIKADHLNILNVVDSWIDLETLELLQAEGPWDMVLWPFQTMREIEVISPSRATAATGELPEEWAEQLKILNPRYLVPSSCQFIQESWSWYNQAFFPMTYKSFSEQMTKLLPGSKVIRINPSVSFKLDKQGLHNSESLPWIRPVGNQDVDYSYDSNLKPPSTAEVARHFGALDEAQNKRVLDYCKVGLLEKFRSMYPSEDPFFAEPRLWKLSIYDHKGNPTHFYYSIQEDSIEACEENEAEIAWLTEAPAAKIYAVLEFGESLTSMYLRINDRTFSPEIESEITSVDIVEDPLIRCLFSNAFGAYQFAQLKRLQAKAVD